MSDVYRSRTPVGQRLGDLLFDAGLVTEAQLNRALMEQQRSGERLGRLLVAADVITEAQLVNVLARHFGLDTDELEERVPDYNARRLLQECIVQLASEQADADAEENGPKVFASPAEAVIDAPVVQFVNDLLARAVAEGATGVHLDPWADQSGPDANEDELRARFRVDGLLRDATAVPPSMRFAVLDRLKIMGGLDVAERRRPQDGRVTLTVGGATVDLRLVALPTIAGESLVVHIHDRSADLTPIEELGFSPGALVRFRSLFLTGRGAVLVVGPAGSGRSTTLYAALAELAGLDERSIVTVEETVTHHLPGMKQVQVDAKAHLGLARTLGAVVDADPDVVLVGEIDDRETAALVVQAAGAGRLVLAALHGDDASSTPARLVDMGVEPSLVTSAVAGFVAQRLVRRLCGSCKEPAELGPAQLAAAGWHASSGSSSNVAPDALQFHRAVGCDQCAGSGYRGRLAVHEVMPVSQGLAALLAARAPADAVRQLAVEEGMATMREDGLTKAAQGHTTLDELLRVLPIGS